MSKTQFLYLTTRGWKTGKQGRIEIWFVEHNERFYILSERREGAHWVQNIKHDPQVSFSTNDKVLGEPEGTYLAISDGYWVFLEPLPPGQHEIRLRGAIIDPTGITPSFETAVAYHLIVSDTAIPSAEQGSNATTTTNLQQY